MPRSKPPLTFETDAAIIDRLGRELVARQETALIELVKNSFDADATKVDVVFLAKAGTTALEIRDNGSGMTREELVDGFLRLASDLKVQNPVSPKYKRRRAGRKGIGRFATQRLGHRLILTTFAQGAKTAFRLTVNWDQFQAGKKLDDVPVKLEETPPGAHGTTIRIEKLRDGWLDWELKQAWQGVLSLQQPFPVAPIKENPTTDPGFKVRVLRRDKAVHDEAVVADIESEILQHLHATIELEVDKKGRARWRLSKNRFGETQDWTPIHHEHPESATPPAYKHLRSVWMKTHYAILNATLFPRLVGTRIQGFLSDQGGVRLYRNGFRVVPYGSPSDDWLQLDALYSKRTFLAPIANRNFFGIIEIRDPSGKLFEEHTSREGLIETPAFAELKGLASSVLVTAATRISEDRGKKSKAGGRPRSKPSAPDLDEVTVAVRAAQEAAATAVREGQPAATQAAAQQVATAVRLLQERQQEVEAARVQLADETSMLRFLATLGMTTAEFSHETGMTFDAFRLDFERVFETAKGARPNDERLLAQAERAKGMLSRLDTLTSYLNTLAGARSARGMHPISVSKAVQDFERGMKAQAESQQIQLEIVTPPYDPLFTKPLHEAEVASVLLNFYTNSVKALKRGRQARKIRVEADRLTEAPAVERIRVRFLDTGDGIPEEIRERVFDAFFTTRISPPAGAADIEHATGAGLGLWIVKQIANNAGGDISLVTPPDDYSTCFEFVLPSEEGAVLQ